MANNATTPASVGNVVALDTKRKAEYITRVTISGTNLNLLNAAGAIVATAVIPDTVYTAATAAKDGLMASADKSKLDGLVNYTLPAASDTVMGGVKLTSATDSAANNVALAAVAGKAIMDVAKAAGKSIELAGTTLTFKDSAGNVLSTVEIPTRYTLPAATTSALGGVKVGSGISVAADGTISVAMPEAGMLYKGKVAAKANLPAAGNKNGDIYLVGAAAPYKEYIWDGAVWELLGEFSDSFDPGQLVLKSDFLTDEAFIALLA